MRAGLRTDWESWAHDPREPDTDHQGVTYRMISFALTDTVEIDFWAFGGWASMVSRVLS